jgi:RNA polymerase sigma-70 factor (ECF subfamily)
MGFSIATRVAADYLRQAERRLQIVEVREAAELPDRRQRIEDRIIVGEMNACVRGVIDSLPEDYRAALILHDLDGLTAQDTATICGGSLATAEVRVPRARVCLRQALGQQCESYRYSGSVLRCDLKS